MVIAAILLIGGINCQTHSCPLFGDDRRYSLGRVSTLTRLFMNFDAPSQCSGTVTQWNYCYLLSGDRDKTFGVKFMVYRERDVAEVYNVVPGSNYTLLRSYSQLEGQECGTVELSLSQQFQIRPNDIISACIILDDVNDIERLTINSNGGRARQFAVDQKCLDDELRTIDAGPGGINSQNARRLHLYATISKSGSYTLLAERVRVKPLSVDVN